MNTAEWFVVMTKPGKQDDVAVKLLDAGFEIFNPRLRQYNARQSKYRVGALFPLYLFIRLDISKHYRLIKYTRGVLRFIGTGTEPVPVAKEIIECIKSNCNSEDLIEARYSIEEILPGDKVVIADGPLKGVEAIVSGICNEQKRVEILLDLMKVTINKGELKRL
ncbi:MAG: hypothetical protein JXA66_05620 [Oligoflexia bacterium]|nr:hypothetical protein [Oligoflexia bacterium]